MSSTRSNTEPRIVATTTVGTTLADFLDTVASPKTELFHWLTILFSQTSGTALGDGLADDTGLGYRGAALVFAAYLAFVVAAYYLTRVPRTASFWAAFILTRPLGATSSHD